ncbi:hypothetical protein KSX_95330 [Ktedonospora formicarum]|uniref:Uncharacterized protein n=1 Tax=Ktedonospora formicarum TaxID=2778364 RepID=A0A8J3MXF4_9CHLR|nr:hypothetical protein KSX_95330 [Ktedonospora formicarum]
MRLIEGMIFIVILIYLRYFKYQRYSLFALLCMGQLTHIETAHKCVPFFRCQAQHGAQAVA